MKKLRVLVVVGTRPELIRLSRVLAAIEEDCSLLLVHTGQNYDYELNQIFFDDLGIREPDYFLNSAKDSTGPASTIGNIIASIDTIIKKETPDCMLVLGDTNSCLSVIAAKRRRVPIFHMEAGNRCFDDRVPEEINRRIVDHTADINLTYSSIAREYLVREGILPDRIIKTGSPMNEVLTFYKSKIAGSKILEELALDCGEYFVVSAHREENIESDHSFARLVAIINFIADSHKLPVIVSTHPRTQARISAKRMVFDPMVRLVKPLSFSSYVKLQLNAQAVLSDSGTISEESSLLGFSALNLREAHERPEAMEEASVMMVGLSLERVKQGLEVLKNQKMIGTAGMQPVSDYLAPNVSSKVVRIIHSYTDYVNRVVWRKGVNE